MREIPAIKQSVRIRPDQATFLPNKEKLFALPDHPIKIPSHKLAKEEKMQGEKKDKIPAKKTEIEKYYRFQIKKTNFS